MAVSSAGVMLCGVVPIFPTGPNPAVEPDLRCIGKSRHDLRLHLSRSQHATRRTTSRGRQGPPCVSRPVVMRTRPALPWNRLLQPCWDCHRCQAGSAAVIVAWSRRPGLVRGEARRCPPKSPTATVCPRRPARRCPPRIAALSSACGCSNRSCRRRRSTPRARSSGLRAPSIASRCSADSTRSPAGRPAFGRRSRCAVMHSTEQDSYLRAVSCHFRDIVAGQLSPPESGQASVGGNPRRSRRRMNTAGSVGWPVRAVSLSNCTRSAATTSRPSGSATASCGVRPSRIGNGVSPQR